MTVGWLRRINKKFDSVKEPNRFFIFIAVLLPGVIMSGVYMYPTVMVAGWFYLLLMLTIRVTYIHGDL